MLKVSLPGVVLMALTFSPVSYSEDYSAPAKSVADKQSMSNQLWWPERLDLAPLRQHAAASSPLDSQFNYANEFKKLDL